MVQLNLKKLEKEILEDILHSTSTQNICSGSDEEMKALSNLQKKMKLL